MEKTRKEIAEARKTVISARYGRVAKMQSSITRNAVTAARLTNTGTYTRKLLQANKMIITLLTEWENLSQ